MYFYVVLTKSKKQLVVPLQWIFAINMSASISEGVNKKIDHLIFYSPNENVDPVFTSQIQEDFDVTKNACYHARIVRCFGKRLKDFV